MSDMQTVYGAPYEDEKHWRPSDQDRRGLTS